MDEDWFESLTRQWRVARTIKDGVQDKVRGYLDSNFKKSLMAKCVPETIDEAAEHLRVMSWSSGKRKDGSASLPLSLVSKIGFFIRPDVLVPLDSYAKAGLNALRGKKKDGFLGRCTFDRYVEYFNEFEVVYGLSEQVIADFVQEKWVAQLNKKLGGEPATLQWIGFRRKILDNLLLGRGRET